MNKNFLFCVYIFGIFLLLISTNSQASIKVKIENIDSPNKITTYLVNKSEATMIEIGKISGWKSCTAISSIAAGAIGGSVSCFGEQDQQVFVRCNAYRIVGKKSTKETQSIVIKGKNGSGVLIEVSCEYD